LKIPRLLAISDPAAVPGPDWDRWCAGLRAASVDGLQVRRPEGTDRELVELAFAARAAFPAPGALFVNRRPEIALTAQADGVQLPSAGLPVAEVARTFGARLLVGRSTHSVEEVLQARDQGADFALFGPIFDTPSKAGRLAARGISLLRDAVATGLPVLAVGGIDQGNAFRVAESGAWGLAAIRWFQDPAAGRPHFEALLRSFKES
jgi:thiamine-phosphate pyrophosphorylase